MPSIAKPKSRRKSPDLCCSRKVTRVPRTRVLLLSSCKHRVCYSCLSKTCKNALQQSVVATCWKCSEEIGLDQVELGLSASAFVSYKIWYRKEMVARLDCVSCSTKIDRCHLRVAPCGHYYCKPCLLRMCRLALGDRALVPLRCCRKELPDDYVREALTGLDYTKYQTLLKEKNWKVSDLKSDADYTATVKAVGAKQCPGCGIGVQRDFGCVHMACPNGHQFCYTCLTVWGTCSCPLIPEAELREILGE